MKLRHVILALAMLALGLALGWSLREFWEIDSCLDAGGRWEEPGGYCEGVTVGPG